MPLQGLFCVLSDILPKVVCNLLRR